MTCCLKAGPMCCQSPSFECSQIEFYHDSVRKNATIILVLEEGGFGTPEPYSWIRHCNALYVTTLTPGLTGLFMEGRGRGVWNPRTLFLGPPLQCTVSFKTSLTNIPILGNGLFLVIYSSPNFKILFKFNFHQKVKDRKKRMPSQEHSKY